MSIPFFTEIYNALGLGDSSNSVIPFGLRHTMERMPKFLDENNEEMSLWCTKNKSYIKPVIRMRESRWIAVYCDLTPPLWKDAANSTVRWLNYFKKSP